MSERVRDREEEVRWGDAVGRISGVGVGEPRRVHFVKSSKVHSSLL